MSSDEFGLYLRTLREKRGLTINQLSTESGISNAQISRIENGLRNSPKPNTIKRLAKVLNVDYQEMLYKAGYIEDIGIHYETPEWATAKDIRDFKKMLEDDAPIMFDGVPIEGQAKQRVLDVLTGLFWEAKEMNKETYGRRKKLDTTSEEVTKRR